MKNNLYKVALLAALGLVSAVSAQAASYNGDLIVGLTTTTGSDLVYDLGTEASLFTGNDSWNLTSALSAAGLSTSSSSLAWGVVGSTQTTPHIEYLTDSGTPAAITAGQYAGINSSVKTLVNNDFTAVGEGNFATPSTSATYSWFQSTDDGTAAPGGAYSSAYTDPNLSGTGTIAFYSSLANGGVTDLGSFTLSGDELTFNVAAVPEPGTYGILGGIGVLLLGLRRQLTGKLA